MRCCCCLLCSTSSIFEFSRLATLPNSCYRYRKAALSLPIFRRCHRVRIAAHSVAAFAHPCSSSISIDHTIDRSPLSRRHHPNSFSHVIRCSSSLKGESNAFVRIAILTNPLFFPAPPTHVCPFMLWGGCPWPRAPRRIACISTAPPSSRASSSHASFAGLRAWSRVTPSRVNSAAADDTRNHFLLKLLCQCPFTTNSDLRFVFCRPVSFILIS